jgi:hypothetical protein
LHQSVGHFERKYEWLKNKNEVKEAKLHQLKIENDNKKKVDDIKKSKDDMETQTLETQPAQEDDGNNEAEYTKLCSEIEQL